MSMGLDGLALNRNGDTFTSVVGILSQVGFKRWWDLKLGGIVPLSVS